MRYPSYWISLQTHPINSTFDLTIVYTSSPPPYCSAGQDFSISITPRLTPHMIGSWERRKYPVSNESRFERGHFEFGAGISCVASLDFIVRNTRFCLIQLVSPQFGPCPNFGVLWRTSPPLALVVLEVIPIYPGSHFEWLDTQRKLSADEGLISFKGRLVIQNLYKFTTQQKGVYHRMHMQVYNRSSTR